MKDTNPIQVFESAISQITPKVEVRSRRVGGASYQIPTPVRGPRGFSLAVRWLVNEARKRPNKEFHTYADKLAAELIAASKGDGGAVAKKISAHKQAESNRAFAHFRFWSIYKPFFLDSNSSEIHVDNGYQFGYS